MVVRSRHLSARSARALAILGTALALTVCNLSAAPAPALTTGHHAAKRAVKRCKHGRIPVHIKGAKGVSCVKPPRHLPKGSGPKVTTSAARAVLASVPLRARGHGHSSHLPTSVGKAVAKYHLKPSVLERLLARTDLPVAFGRARGVTEGPTIDGWQTTIELDSDGQVTATATKGGATMKATSADVVKFDTCPDVDGRLAGTRTSYTRLLLTVQQGGRTRAKIEINNEADAKFTAYVTDDQTIKLFDVVPFHAYIYVHGEVYDEAGKTVLGTPPWLATMRGAAQGIPLGNVTGAVLDAHGTRLEGDMPSSTHAAVESFVSWVQFEFLVSARRADDHLAVVSGHFGGCLDLSVRADKTTLAPGESTTLTLRVSPHDGGGLAPVHLDNHGGAGAVAPASAATTGAPVQVTFTAPASGWKGTTAYFAATSRQGGGYAEIALAAKPGDHFVLVLSHESHADSHDDVNTPSFVGTVDHHEAFDVTTTIPLSGDPSTSTVTGSGPIDYTLAQYHYEQDGTFHGQGTCSGTDRTDLTATHGGTARVLGVHVSGSDVTLDFAPGTYPTGSTGLPSETYHNVQTYDVCPGADNTYDEALFLNRFQNQYFSSGWVYGSDPHVHLTTGWVAGSGDVVASLDVSGLQGGETDSPWADHYEIRRLP